MTSKAARQTTQKKTDRSALLVQCLALLMALGATAQAQPAVAGLAGRVVDPQGAPIPGATVSVQSLATSSSWATTTSEDGQFSLPLLPPGAYKALVELSGFSTWQADELVLQVGQRLRLDVRLALAGVRENVSVEAPGRPASSAVDGVLSAAAIETLPLNGRNFLELSLLVPGNAPTPTFDPTKTNSVLIASAGQMGRGGNVTIDGQDNNDDVVGGPLLNLPIDAVEEFQIATSRFGAELGRSASSAVNVVTRSGTNVVRGSASLYARDGAWQTLPATIDDEAEQPPFDRQQVSGAAGGPFQRDRLFWFAAAELRHQDGGVQVGTRDTAARTIRRSFAEAPLSDRLWTLRLDAARGTHRVSGRYAGQSANDTSSSAGERAMGSATQRQTATNRYNAVLGTWTAAPAGHWVNSLSGSVSTFLNVTEPAAVLPQLTFPSLVDGASFRMPQETRQTRTQIANTTAVIGAGTACGSAASGSASTPSSGSACSSRDAWSWCRTSPPSITRATDASTTTISCSP